MYTYMFERGHEHMLVRYFVLVGYANTLSLAQGLRNDFKDAMDKLDQEYLDQLAKHEVLLL